MMEMESSLKSNSHSKDYPGIMAKESNEVPNLEPISSYDSSSTTAMSESTASPSRSMTTVTVPELLVETSTALQQVQREEQLLAMAEDDVSLLSPDNGSESLTQQYFSKQEFQTLLTPTFIECLAATTEEYNTKKQAQRLRRKELIQQELEAIIQGTATTMANDEGQEFEPEAVEALGIAANRVAYLKKYYDVTSCKYIHVPSVAYTILNGSLLEEACKHYFGKSEEFLIAYAANLGTTVLQHGLPQVLLGQDLDNDADDDIKEDLLSPDDAELGLNSSPNATATSSHGTTLWKDTTQSSAIKFWGVSPLSTAQSIKSSTMTFTFDSSVTPTKLTDDGSVPPTTNGSTMDSSVLANKNMSLDSSGTPPQDNGTGKDLVAGKKAILDCSGTPMESTFDYSITPQNMTFYGPVTPNNSPADSSGDVYDFSFASPEETKVATKKTNSTPKDSPCNGSIVAMPWKTVDSPNQPLDSSVTVQPATIVDSPVMPQESSSGYDFTMRNESLLDVSDKPNALTLDSLIATNEFTVLSQDSTRNGSATPKDSTTSPSPDKAEDSKMNSSVSVKDATTVDSSVIPENRITDCSSTPTDMTSNSADDSLAAKDVTVDRSVVSSNSTIHGSVTPKDSIFTESVKPYDSDSTCEVRAHDLTLDSVTVESSMPNNLTNHDSCLAPTDSAKDGSHKGSVSTNKTTIDCSVQTSGSINSSSVAAKDASAAAKDSKSNLVVKSIPRLFFLLALIISLAIGVALVFSSNNLPTTMEQQQQQQQQELQFGPHYRQHSREQPLTHKSTPVQKWESLETLTTVKREDSCNSNSQSISKEPKEKGSALVTNDYVATSSIMHTPKHPTRARPIVPNLLY